MFTMIIIFVVHFLHLLKKNNNQRIFLRIENYCLNYLQVPASYRFINYVQKVNFVPM